MSIQSIIDQQITDSVHEALNENDIELIQWIEKFRDNNTFGNDGTTESMAVNDAFKFACNEIIKHINES